MDSLVWRDRTVSGLSPNASPHRKQRPPFHRRRRRFLIVRHALRRNVENHIGVINTRAALRLDSQKQNAIAVGSGLGENRIDGRKSVYRRSGAEIGGAFMSQTWCDERPR
ncbi:hypothetical protein SDJN02_22406, partial [Cucurbita argyrosperma subsp. argyrosperma]